MTPRDNSSIKPLAEWCYAVAMVVYVEAVLFDNFCLDCLLAYLTVNLTGGEKRFSRFALSAAVGSALALIVPLIPSVFSFGFKVATLLLCSFLFSYKCRLRRYLINTFVYLLLSFVLSGLFSFLLGGSSDKGLIDLSLGGTVGCLSLAALLLTYAVRQIGGLIREKRMASRVVLAEVINRDRSVKLRALFDSGNLLTDRDGKGVVVTDRRRLTDLGELLSCGEMRVNTATGSRVLPLVKIPEIKIYSGGHENIMSNVTAALSDLPDEYALILPSE